jgi:hypothetical protein
MSYTGFFSLPSGKNSSILLKKTLAMTIIGPNLIHQLVKNQTNFIRKVSKDFEVFVRNTKNVD